MRKLIVIIIGVASLFLMGCDDVLSVVTVNEKGEKVIHNYISLLGNTVYDDTISLKNWKDTAQLKDQDLFSGELLVSIVSKKENIVVIGTTEYAMEIKFFEGGYKYTVFMSADSLSKALQ